MSQDRPAYRGSAIHRPEELDVLRRRAAALARPPLTAAASGAQLDVIEFSLAAERYAIEVDWVREVQPLENLTPLPCTPAFVLGLVNLRGWILPVIDLRTFFELPETGLTDLHRILVIATDAMRFGVLADQIVDTYTIAADALQAAPPTVSGRRADYLKGVTADRLVVLDAGRLLADERLIVHETVDG